MAENEGEVIAGMDIVARLIVEQQQALATVVRTTHGIQEYLNTHPQTVTVQVAGGTQIQRAAEEVANKLKFAFSGTLQANTNIQQLEESLRSMMATSEQAGQKLDAVFKSGAKGGPTYKIQTQQDVGPALEAVQRHRADFPAQQMQLSVSGRAIDETSYAGAASAFAGVTKAAPDPFGRGLDKATSDEQKRLAKEEQRELEANLAQDRKAQAASERLAAPDQFGRGMDKATADEQKRLAKEEQHELEANLAQDRKAQAASERLSAQKQKEQEAGDKLAKWMDLWASGGRPQRALGSFLQGPLTSMLGPEMGAMGAGLGAMIGGGALFHIGWEITNQLSKLPEHIMEQIDIAREFNRMRAAATTGPAPLADMPAASPEAIARVQTDQTLRPRVQAAHDFWTRMRGDPKRYDSIMASLLMNVPAGDMKDAKKRDHWIETIDRLANQSLLAETMFPGETGKAENDAFTRMRMLVEHGGKGREALLGQKAFMDMAIQRLQAEYPHLQKAPRETLESVVRARVSGPSGNVAGGRFPGQWTAEDIDQLISSNMGTTPQMEGVIKQMMGEENWAAWRQEHSILWTDYSQRSMSDRKKVNDLIHDLSRPLEAPGPSPSQPTLDYWRHPPTERNAWLETEQGFAERKQRYERYAALKPYADEKGHLTIPEGDVGKVAKILGTTTDILAIAAAKAGTVSFGNGGNGSSGILNPLFGTGGKPPHLPAWGPGTYSFSSMSGFANKMQTEAGIHLDWNEKNHDELVQIHAVLAARLGPPDPGGHKPIETPAAN